MFLGHQLQLPGLWLDCMPLVFLGESARFRLDLWTCLFLCVYVCVCVCRCASVCYNRSHTSYLEKIKSVKITFVDFDICHRLAKIAKIVLCDHDLLLEGQRFEWRPSHSGERPFRFDECKYCCTRSSSIARYKLTHSSKCPFKCDECEFQCDEGDICSKTNRQLTRHKRARHLRIVLPDRVPFV